MQRMKPRIATALLALIGAVCFGSSAARADLLIERTVREYGPKPAPAPAPAAEAPAATAEPARDGAAARAPQAPAAPPKAEAKPEIVELSARSSKLKMAPGRFRETSEDGKTVTVMRSDQGVLWLIDTENKTYREIALKSLSSAARSSRDRLSKRLPTVSDPAMRERLEVWLGTGEDLPPVAIERPGTKKTIAGEECELVIVKAGADELFRAFIARRQTPALEEPWLRAGLIFSREAADKLAEIEGLVMEAVFPLPDGGRIEIGTDRIAEIREEPGDYDDPAKSGLTRLGGLEKASRKKSDEKESDEKKPDGKKSDGGARTGKGSRAKSPSAK